MNLPVSARLIPDQRTRPARPHDWMLSQLPIGMQEDEFLMRFVRIFQDVADGLLVHADGLPHLADVTVTPPAMVRWLGHWIGVDMLDERMDEILQRALVRVFGDALRWRGTARGLRPVVELLAGLPVTPRLLTDDDLTAGDFADSPVIIDDTGGFIDADDEETVGGHVVVRTPGSPFMGERDLAQHIRALVPASVTLAVVVDGELVYTDRLEEGPTP